MPVAFLSLLPPAVAEVVPSTRIGDLDYACTQPVRDRVECDYRPLTTDTVTTVTAKVQNVLLPAPKNQAYPGDNDITAILFLVDAGPGDGQDALELRVRHLKTLAGAAKPHHRIGLASFNGDPKISVALSAVPEHTLTAANDLVTVKNAAREYRDALEAVEKLANYEAKRKAIFFLSDGQADARAYYHQELIAAARNADVSVHVIAYPRSGAPRPGLQALRRLAVESSGSYLEAYGARFSLPDPFMADPFKRLDNGGHITVVLRAAIEAGLAGNQQLELALGLPDKTVTAMVPIDLSRTSGKDEVAGRGVPPATGETSDLPAGGSGFRDAWYAYAILLAGVMVGIYATRFPWRRNKAGGPSARTTTNEIRAYLIRHDGQGTRYFISKTPWRIGRGKDNELTLIDTSVSRHHAEILGNRDAGFSISDLNSLNGVFVNDKQVKSAVLSEGCEIDVGDIAFTFTLQETALDDPADTQRCERTPDLA